MNQTKETRKWILEAEGERLREQAERFTRIAEEIRNNLGVDTKTASGFMECANDARREYREFVNNTCSY